YEVESGGTVQEIGGKEVRVAFESPSPRGYDELEGAVEGAKEHIRTQFARVGVDEKDVVINIEVE
ncbi:MAG: hypothetical protein SXQ77_08930, partial [Halobacteria archaeon]|nr:hypothetical protein [Halobacteria archaeon]